ncbi:MAG: Fur family transcriptional regulator [Terricaulis sp.]
MNAKTHEHGDCQHDGALTATQREVLNLIRQCKSPVKAYDLLRILSERRGPVAPPTIYRVLRALTAKGLVHRIECLNAYTACVEAADCDHGFLICSRCGVTREIVCAEASQTLRESSAKAGFSPAQVTLEIRGVCLACITPPH